jgi:hypothetical protein
VIANGQQSRERSGEVVGCAKLKLVNKYLRYESKKHKQVPSLSPAVPVVPFPCLETQPLSLQSERDDQVARNLSRIPELYPKLNLDQDAGYKSYLSP